MLLYSFAIRFLAGVLVFCMGCTANAAQQSFAKGKQSSTLERELSSGFGIVDTVRFEGKLYTLHEGNVEGRPALIVVRDDRAQIVRDYDLAIRIARAALLVARYNNPAEFAELRRIRDRYVADYLKLQALAEVALFFRDAASEALVDVGAAYLIGDPSVFARNATRKLAREAAQAALKKTVAALVNDPESYLRALTVKALKDAGAEIDAVEREFDEIRDPPKVRTIEQLHLRLREALATIVPAETLILALRPNAGISGQLQSFLNTVRGKLTENIPAQLIKVADRPVYSRFLEAGDAVDALLAKSALYQTYQRSRKAYLALPDEQLAIVPDRIAHGLVVSTRWSEVPSETIAPLIWLKRLEDAPIEIMFHRASSDIMLYSDMVFRLDRAGNIKWRFKPYKTACHMDQSNDGRLIVIGTCTQYGIWVHMIDDAGNELWRVKSKRGADVAISSDGGWLIAAGYEGGLVKYDRSGTKLWDLHAVKPSARVTLIGETGNFLLYGGGGIAMHNNDGVMLWRHEVNEVVYQAALAGNNELIVIGGRKGGVHVLNREGRLVWEFPTAKPVYSVAAAGGLIVAGGGDRMVLAFDHRGAALWSHGTEDSIWHIAVSPEGSAVVLGDDRGNITALTQSGEVLFEYDAQASITGLAISHDGKYVVAGSKAVKGGRLFAFRLQ